MTKAEQWAEKYRTGTDGEIKDAIKTFYDMKAWHELHVALWVWLSLDGEREKREWFEAFDVPKVEHYCFACEVAATIDATYMCCACPLEQDSLEECTYGLYDQWVHTHKIAEREELARKGAELEWLGNYL